MKHVWIGVLTLAAVLAAATPARADERLFTYTYDWFTPQKHEKELELTWTQGNGGTAEGLLEFEYGVTNRYVVAPYLVLGREHGGDLRVEGWRLEQRYRLGSYGRNRFLPALYLEMEKGNGEPYNLEGKFITSYLFGDNFTWSSNLIAEGLVADRSQIELGYATGVARPITDHLTLGVELFGSVTEREHFFGPTVGYRFAPGTKLLVTGGFRYAGPEGGAVRLLFEKEWR
jgi:hypothetical protein